MVLQYYPLSFMAVIFSLLSENINYRNLLNYSLLLALSLSSESALVSAFLVSGLLKISGDPCLFIKI